MSEPALVRDLLPPDVLGDEDLLVRLARAEDGVRATSSSRAS